MILEFIDSYFFAEVNPIPYAVMRIMTGLLFLFMFFELLVSYQLIAPINEGGFLFLSKKALWNVPTIFKHFGCSYLLFLYLYLICSVCITVGFFSTAFLILQLYLHLSFRSYASALVGGSDQIIHIFCFWLIFANTDQMFSVSSLFFTENDTLTTRYAGVGLIANIALFYCVSVPLKFKGTTWRSGIAVWNVMNFPDRHKWRWPAKFLVNKKIIVQFMTYYVMIVEILVPIGFFVKPLIPVWIFLLTCMHVGIELTMYVGLFGYCMFAFLIFLLLTYIYW